MDPAKWIDLVVSLSFGTTFFLLLRYYIRKRSLMVLYFSIAALIISIPYFTDLFMSDLPINLFEWGKLISITVYISGLLVLIRESKPIFARFPQYLTALPFVSFLFFPIIVDSIVIKDLLNAIYQGGAIIVTMLVFTLNQAKKNKRRYYVLGLSLVGLAYLTYWLYFNRNTMAYYGWISEILLSAGILITVFRFVKGDDQ